MKIPHIKYKDFLKNQKLPKKTDKNYVEFWLKHINYCKSGVYVGGIYISGWLYWHLNFFKVPLDAEDEWGNPLRIVGNPIFRDNEYFIDWGIRKAKKESKPLIVFGSRRIGKSTILASRTTYTNYLVQNSSTLIIGASSKDIANITEYYDKFYENRAECFEDLKKFGIWSRQGGNLEIAFSKKESTKKDIATKKRYEVNPVTHKLLEIGNENRYIFSYIAVRNLESGQKLTKEELLAGITPSEVILDEAGKWDYVPSFSALRPALMTTSGKYRTIPLLIGTGGNTDLSKSMEKDFLYTETSGFCHIDVEEYKKEINPNYFQYTQKSHLKVGLFPCAEMSNAGGQKIEIPLSDYILKEYTKKDLEDLEGFTIWVTDWKNAKDNVLKEIKIAEASSDLEERKAKMYFPFQPEDCFLHSSNNDFPVEEARKAKIELIESGLIGENVELDQDEKGNVIISSSNKIPIKKYPYDGGAYDAPVVILERPISDNPDEIKWGTYCAGFDGYKIATSETTDSIGVIYIFKRYFDDMTGYRHQIVAYLATRPTQDTKFYRQCYLLLKKYNAEVLPERDSNFFNYMQSNKAMKYWANCKNLGQGIVPNTIADFSQGLPPTVQNKQHVLKLVQNYCWEEIIVDVDAEGKPITILGIKRISDPMLLEEIASFNPKGNFDRIIAFGHALAWDAELSKNKVIGGKVNKEKEFRIESLLNKLRTRPNKYRI